MSNSSTPWTAAHQASLSFTISQSWLKLMSIESVMLSKYLPHPFPHPSPLALNLSQHQGLFQWVSSSNQVAKYWHFSFSISPSYWIFRVDFLLGLNWFDHFIVQGTLKSLFQHHSSKASIVWHSAFFMVQLSHLYMTTGKTVALTICTFVCKLLSLLFNMLSMLVIAFLPRSKHFLFLLWSLFFFFLVF